MDIPDGSSSVVNSTNFLQIKQFVLTNGLSQTYCQIYNNNPYYGFTKFNAYLEPDTGQANINCDRSKSDFNHLCIQADCGSGNRYWEIIWNREQHMLRLQKAWSTVPKDILKEEVEAFFRKMLMEIGKGLVTHPIEQQNTNQVFLMNRMIAQIHLDIRALKPTHSWLFSYDDPCLLEGGSVIFYMPKLKKEAGFAPQFPDQLLIRYEPLNIKQERTKGGEDKGIFQFPSLNIKVCAHIVIWGKENEGLADSIRQCIINRCQSLKDKLEK